MSSRLHILSFQNRLKEEREFLKSLLCRQVSRRRLILNKATSKQLHLLQKLLTLFVRGEIGVSNHFVNRIKRSKKLNFIEQKFHKIQSNPNLKQHLVSLAPILHLFVKVTLKTKK